MADARIKSVCKVFAPVDRSGGPLAALVLVLEPPALV
jgi:hypothetical protein